MTPGRRVRLAMAAATVVATATGCAGKSGGFPDRTARVDLGGTTTTYAVVSCGLDGPTAFVVGRAPNGSVVQAAIGVEADHTTGVPASTAITASAPGLADAPGAATTVSTLPPGAIPGTAVPPAPSVAPVAGTAQGVAQYEAFGAESWHRRGKAGRAPGTITFARIKGARIQARGTADPVDVHEHRLAEPPVSITFDARCDAPSKH